MNIKRLCILLILLLTTNPGFSQIGNLVFISNAPDTVCKPPTLLVPTEGATGEIQSPTLTWSKITNATGYIIQITNYVDFSFVLITYSHADTFKKVDILLDEGSKWYWRVNAYNVSDTSDWSSIFTFTVTEGIKLARTYFVDANNGKDEYSGRTMDKPWKTLSKVNKISFIPGDTILFRGGDTFTGQIKHFYTHDDTVDAIIYGSYGTGKGKIRLGTSDTAGIWVQFTKHVKIKITNLIVEGLYHPLSESGGSNFQQGIFVRTYGSPIFPLDSNHISKVTISHCEVYKVRNSGIRIVVTDYGRTVTCHIDSNLVYDCGAGPGIYMVFNWLSNSRIYGNTVRDIFGIKSRQYVTGIATDLCKGVTVQENLVYNIGANSAWSGLGIVTGASKNIKVIRNEIYGIINISHTDGEAIDFENGSDSCLAEFNYIHDTQGQGILLSGNTSKNSIIRNYLTYVTERGSIDSGTCDYNVIRYNLIKNWGIHPKIKGFPGLNVVIGADYPVGYPPGRNNEVYNNTLINTKTSRAGNVGINFTGHSHSTKIFNNIIIGNSIAFFWTDSKSTKKNTIVQNNVYWNFAKIDIMLQTGKVYTDLIEWSLITGYDTNHYKQNPLLADAFNTVGDTLNNAGLIQTLSKYVPIDGSIARENGLSLPIYTQNEPISDIRGLPFQTNGRTWIGAFTDTSSIQIKK